MSFSSRSIRNILTAVSAVALVASFLTASLPAAHALVSPLAASSSFNSQFNGDHSGWSVVSGTWKDTATAFKTTGTPDKYNSIRHTGNYTNFVYTVRMKRTGSEPNLLNFLYIRGNPLPLAAFNLWDEGYTFGYTASGLAFVGGCVGGLCDGFGMASPAVITGPNYNVLKVFAYGPWLLFYINGTLVFPFLNYFIPDGSVGITMARSLTSTGDKLLVDWAKLTKITADPGPLPNVKYLTLQDLEGGSLPGWSKLQFGSNPIGLP